MKIVRLPTLALASFSVFGLLGNVEAATTKRTDASAYIQKVVDGAASAAGVAASRGKTGWWATGWSKTDGSGFYGMPVPTASTTESDDTSIIVRYTRYATDYDAEFHAPIWGAYTLDKTAVANDVSGERPASNPDFARPPQFFQEPLVVSFSQQLGVPAASHGTFTTTFDPRFPMLSVDASVTAAEAKDANFARAIQRGHMVPNNAMKCQGDHDQGQVAQLESFSVANIVPQVARSNAPSWSSLESACFDWANELGQVWLIVGPIFHDHAKPTFIKKIKGGAEQILPSPDELFYVVIGKRNGKTSAVGFIMPHIPEIVGYKAEAVSVRKIEEITGLNFMPELGANDEVETSYDPVWLQTKQRAKANDGDADN